MVFPLHHLNPQALTVNPIAKLSITLLALVSLGLVPERATANPVPVASDAAGAIAQATPDIDTSVTREYEPAIIYVPDPATQELVPQSVLVTSDTPAVMAVGQIVEAYEGQDVGITGYEVSVNPQAREAEVNFELEPNQSSEVFQSLSSANQYSLFEAIRETLLTQPMYGVDEVIFQANDSAFDI
ncbi:MULTISPECIES: hypothetical protein [unclassified Leptolyngbya]|uniref:hypothetical protein n=1 Tax=unclassified Leptolyngbya TaxID=2650499 RepID=UPI0016853CC3|nr:MULTISPECIES: hypothetical protein [unclassified Leptolyngbya]MBD1912648.1 hypothetical protein [Leptolyngbya sp. FACHB-8]MBD2156819.1 hypothetical protein [Leptolyngbya sp. FACHB-16]